MVSNILEFKTRILHLRKQFMHKSMSLLQITVNIPGPDKHIYPASQLFNLSISQVLSYCLLDINSIKYIGHTDPIMLCIICCDLDPIELKSKLLALEDSDPLSKYWDLDVFSSDFMKISRSDLNYPERKCFICQLSAKLCTANQTHPIGELIETMVNEYNNVIYKSRV